MAQADILTVTLNPTMDVSTTVSRLVDHQKLRCSGEQEQVGGGGINVAMVSQSLGANVSAFWPIGGWRGQEILEQLTRDGIRSINTAIAQENRQCFTVYETDTEHEYRFVLPGPTLNEAEQAQCLSSILAHLPRQFLVLSGSLPQGVTTDFYAKVIHAVKQADPSLRLVVDTSGPALTASLEAGVFLFKPSLEEFGDLTGQQNSSLMQCASLCRDLIRKGRAQIIALTMGAQGSLVVSDDQAWHVPSLNIKVTSTVGAGDSYVGGFIHAYTQTHDLTHAAKLGTAAAAAALQTQGKLTFDSSKIKQLADQVMLKAVEPV